MPNDLHDAIQNNNPGCIFEAEHEGFDIVPFALNQYGWYVCTRCGNRGTGTQPPFGIQVEIEGIISSLDGCVSIEYDTAEIVRAIISDLKYDVTEANGILMLSGDKIVLCTSCGGHVAPGELMLDQCEERGCGGCIYCANLKSRKEVTEACSNCHTVIAVGRHGYDKNEWREMCQNTRCPLREASETYYNLSLGDLIDQYEKTIL